MENADSLRLYNYYRSSSSYRVRIALHLKHLKFEYEPVHLLSGGDKPNEGQQHSATYQSLNPFSQVPTLVHGKNVLTQSIAIIQYLDSLQTKPKLLPYEPLSQALVLQFCEIINSGIQPLQNVSVTAKLENMFQATTEQKTAWIHYWMSAGYLAIEAFLEKHSGVYCYGDQITAADCFLIPQVFSSQRFGFETKTYKNISRIYESCMELEAFILASPSRQIDAN